MTEASSIVLFWCSLAILFLTFLGYPLIVGLLARLGGRTALKPQSASLPAVSVVVVAHNESARIADRIRNLLASDYPLERVEIIVVSDGSTDSTSAVVTSLQHPSVSLIESPERRGKAAGLNSGVAAARGEIIVFADARQTFERTAIRELASNFHDPQVGAVGGELLIESASTAVGGGVDFYWRLEKFIRKSESAFDSTIGCTGAIYAVRRQLFRPIPNDTILDDVVVPMQIVLAGYRVIFDETAIARDPQQTDPDREHRRKRRTLAGNFQMLFRHSAWLFPWRNRACCQLICHKYLRLVAPLFLLLLFISNALLIHRQFYRALFAFHLAFYSLAALGILLRSARTRFLSIPAGFVFLNAMTVAGLGYYLGGSYKRGWAKNSGGRP